MEKEDCPYDSRIFSAMSHRLHSPTWRPATLVALLKYHERPKQDSGCCSTSSALCWRWRMAFVSWCY